MGTNERSKITMTDDEVTAYIERSRTCTMATVGPDGHTASLVPGDPVLEVSDRRVAVTGEYQGLRRMTLTYPELARVRTLLWIITGDEKREPLAKLLARDPSIPAGRVEPGGDSLILADPAAADQG